MSGEDETRRPKMKKQVFAVLLFVVVLYLYVGTYLRF